MTKPRNFELVQVHEVNDCAEVIIRDRNNFYAFSGDLKPIDNPRSVYPSDYFDENIVDLSKTKTKYVWVTYDPLYERVVCVHEKPNTDCEKCKTIRNKRRKEKCTYFLETSKFKIKP